MTRPHTITINLGGGAATVHIDRRTGNFMGVEIDGTLYTGEPEPKPVARAAKPRKPKAGRETARARAALVFIEQAKPLIGWPLSDDEQKHWRARVADMCGLIRGGYRLGQRAHRDELLMSICKAVVAASKRAAASSDLPWYASALGLQSWPATASVVKSAYRQLALERHPDRGGSHQSFVDLQKAYHAALAALGLR